MEICRVIGLMSGTSLDGVDAALLRTDGNARILREAFLTVPYDAALREEIRACFGAHPDRLDAKTEAVGRKLTEVHAQAVRALLVERGLTADDIDLIGFHGQTISHAP
ncbi:MAG: anhydro-N-acetylmuramic acid kinase, partial [Alphaproteobacteria bacterium]|nr:anhydro-N-acetylmuramic acid kinase [Alphaproteobacteria bacterium]